MVFEEDVYYGNCSNYNPILKSGQLVRETMSLSRLHFVKDIVNDVHAMLHQRLEHYDPVTIALVAVSSTWILSKLWHMHSDDQGIYKRLKANFFKVVKAFPPVRNYIQSEKDKVFVNQVQMLNATDDTNLWHMALPNKGRTADEVMKLAATYEAMQGPKYKDGRVSGAAFSMENDDEEMKMYSEVLINYAWANPLWPKLFPGIRKMEAEVIRMCATLLGGDMETCGSMTTGGTMSILMACLAHRNRAMKKGILFPEMIIPSSAHAAFTKAAEVFRIIVHKIPVDKKTYKVDIRKMRRAINSNTCMLVGSAPNFPFGTVDDIESIGQLGLKFDVPVHVDACLGGFLLPFLPGTYNFDFRVPGVSSMSADTHKYGLAPKGSSVVLYKNREYLHNQYFCDADWQGGIYASSTLEGSRSGSNIALCWAALHYHGTDKYTEHAVAVQQVCKQLRTGIKQIPELRLQGEDDVCIISWSSDVIDINRYHHMMGERDWQLSGLQFPSGVHIMLTPLHTQKGVIEAFLEDSRQVVKEIVATPNKCLEGTAAFYGMSQKIPDRSIVEEFAHTYLDACYAKP